METTTIEVPKEKAIHLLKISDLETEALKLMAEKSDKYKKQGTLSEITKKLKTFSWAF